MLEVSLKSIKLMEPELRAAARECGAQIIRAILEEVRDRAKDSMKQGHGRPSKPGTPPNIQTGHLHAGIMASSEKTIEQQGFGVVVSRSKTKSGLDYGMLHEFGGRFHPPRPFLRPAWAKVKRLGIAKFVKARGIRIEKTKAGSKFKKGRFI